MTRALIVAAACVIALMHTARAEDTPLATQAEVETALQVFAQWTAAYQAEDYDAQWRLTDPRIRRWWDEKRWRKAMVKARRKDGQLTGYAIQAADPIDAAKLPCTEMRHCYRRGVPYVVIILRSTYEKVAPGQPEYAAMAKSAEGWRFGGGTFPNRPLGETAVILTESDESLYRPNMPTVR
jgi:hypothetical protein